MDSLSIGALTAAKNVAARHGLDVRECVVVSDGGNLLVHLKPGPVLARIATTTGLIRRPVGAWLARDVAVAGYLAGQGAPVVAPSGELPPGPHHEDGYAITFWKYVAIDANAAAPSAAEAAPLLRDLHRALRGYTPAANAPLPYLGVVLEELPRWLKFLEVRHVLSGSDLIALREAQWRVAEVLRTRAGEAQPLHGDAHRSNLLCTEGGLLWTDFEDTCTGPVAWDLACLFRTAPEGGEAVLRAYAEGLTWNDLAPYREARNLEGVIYRLVQSVRFPERRKAALERLEEWRKGGRARPNPMG
jgi:aminoglycoside phosphotransferase (APT) family kinase protein